MVEMVRKVWDSQMSAELPLKIHQDGRKRRENNELSERYALSMGPIPENPDSKKLFDDYVHKVIESVNNHSKHNTICHKPPVGKIKCRLCMPRNLKLLTGPTQIKRCGETFEIVQEIEPPQTLNLKPKEPFPKSDDRIIIWELKREKIDANHSEQTDKEIATGTLPISNGNITEYSPALTSSLGSNTCVSPLGDLIQSKAIIFYMLKYMTKDSTALTQSLSCIIAAGKHIQKHKSTAPDSGTLIRTARHFIIRTLNNLSGIAEFSQSLCAAALLGQQASIKSHNLWTCYHLNAKLYLSNKVNENLSRENDSSDSDISEDSDSDPFEDDDLDILHADRIKENDEIEGDNRGSLKIKVEQSSEGTKSVSTYIQQHIHYENRGKELEHYNFFAYTGCINIVLRKNLSTNSDHNSRKQNPVFHFDEEHPQFLTHAQQLLSKLRIPQLGWFPVYPGPRKNTKHWETAAKKWAQEIATTFIPWNKSTYHQIPWTFTSLTSYLQLLNNNTGPNRIIYLIIKEIAQGLSIKQSVLKTCSIYRGQNATVWKKGDFAKSFNFGAEEYTTEDVNDALIQAKIIAIQLAANSDDPLREDLKTKYIRETADYLKETFAIEGTTNAIAEIQRTDIVQNIEQIDLLKIANTLKTYVHDDSRQDTSINPTESLPQPTPTLQDTISLDPIQQGVYNKVKNHIQHDGNSEPLLLLLHGGPGTGKSTLVNYMIQKFGAEHFQCLAPTGIAASLLKNGQTYHLYLGINSENPKLELNPMKKAFIEQDLAGVKIIVIDEISFVGPNSLHIIDARLKSVLNNQRPFGGMGIIVCGDFSQLPPVKAQSLANFTKIPHGRHTTQDTKDRVKIGNEIFKQFIKIDLTTQNRSNDPLHTENINSCRDMSKTINAWDIIKNYGSTGYQTLKQIDPRQDPLWFWAPIVVATNAERDTYNLIKLQTLAKKLKTPIITWKKNQQQLH